jgi:hypothetical protein
VGEGKPGRVMSVCLAPGWNPQAMRAMHGEAHLSISARITSITSSGRREMFLWPRSMVMPGCCCCSSRGADSAAARWLMSLRECSKAAFARATTSSSEMGVGASLLIAGGSRWSLAMRRQREARTCCSLVGRGRGQRGWVRYKVKSIDSNTVRSQPGTSDFFGQTGSLEHALPLVL